MQKSNQQTRPKGFYGIVFLLLITSVLITVYWSDFFINGDLNVTKDRSYLDFEKSFPLADGWTALASLLSLVGLLRRKHWGVLFGIITGAGLLMTGMMDVLYNLNMGNYLLLPTNVPMIVELILNLLCLSMGTLLIVYLWRNRMELYVSDS